MSYNLSFMDNVTGITEIGTELNNATGQVGGLMLMVLFFLGILAMLKSRGYDTIVSLVAASFINTVIASLFMFMGWITWYYGLIPFVVFIISAITYYFQD